MKPSLYRCLALVPAFLARSAFALPSGSPPSGGATLNSPIPQAGPASGFVTSNRVVATVNGRPILQSEVNDLMQASLLDIMRRFPDPAERDAEIQKQRKKVLESLIDQELILKEFEPYAASAGPRVEAHAEEMIKSQFIDGMFKGDRRKFYHELQESGIGYKKFFEQQKKNVIVEMMRGQFAPPDTPYITEEQKAAWLRKNNALFRVDGKIKLWSITIPGIAEGKTPAQQLALAKEVRASLVNGADFASLARTHSEDSKRDAGGSWDWIEKKDLADPFWPVVSKLETGKISEIVSMGGSYYIFWVEARQAGKMKPQAEVDARVEQGVKMEKRMKASEEWLKKLRRKATIVYPQ